jgi:hypothetical protein
VQERDAVPGLLAIWGDGGVGMRPPLPLLAGEESVKVRLGDTDAAAMARESEAVVGQQAGAAPAVHQNR